MICPPCAQAADAETRFARQNPDLDDLAAGHRPEICRDQAIQPGGCPCQHKPPAPPQPKEVRCAPLSR